jgi:golgin subfamily B member 1
MSDDASFELGSGFAAGEVSGSLGLGPLEAQYEELFGEVLADGVITPEERERLEKAADNMGLDRVRLLKLEQAMLAAYQARHKIEIIEHYEEPAASLVPLRVEADGDAGRILLLKRIEQLETRIHELEDELKRAQAAINVEVDLGELETTAAEASEDPEEVWRRVRRNPTAPEPLRELYSIYDARADQDRKWCVAQALVALGAASPEQSALFEAHRSHTLIAPRASLSASAWHDFLFHPEEEVLTGQIFSLIAPAVLVGRVTTLRRDGKLHQPPPSARQDTAKATITAVRALPWAAAILGLAAPAIFLEKDRDTGFEHIPGVPPISVVGKRVLSGRTQHEHAFLAGRHLTLYRHEHFVKTLFSAVPDLEDLFLAALVIGNPGLPIAEGMKQRVQPIAQAISPMLEPPQLDALRGCFLRFVEEGGRTNLQRWSASVDKTACRAGLLLSGDLGSALGLLESEEGAQGELGRDLIAFVTSERYFKLRRQLGIAIES